MVTAMTTLLALSLLASLNREAVSAYQNNDLVRAEALYRRALAAPGAPPSDRAKVHSNLAALYKRQRRLRLAAKHYQHAIRLTHPDSAIATNNLGEIRRLQGRTAEAIGLFQRAAATLPASSPDLPIVLHNLAVAEAGLGRHYTVSIRSLQPLD